MKINIHSFGWNFSDESVHLAIAVKPGLKLWGGGGAEVFWGDWSFHPFTPVDRTLIIASISGSQSPLCSVVQLIYHFPGSCGYFNCTFLEEYCDSFLVYISSFTVIASHNPGSRVYVVICGTDYST